MSIESACQNLKMELSVIKQGAKLSFAPIKLLGASKSQPPEIIEKAIKAGISVFGENRVQEARTKWPVLKKRHPHVELHLIGPLQTNKVRDALVLFDVIQTLDREKLAEELSRVGGWGLADAEKNNATHDPRPATRYFYIQVNTGEEPQKAGIFPAEADRFIEYCLKDLALPVVGLMCIPPVDQPPAPHFALLRKIAIRNHLPELSMGMSEDYKTAIRMGSTCVRIGRALFGERLT